jgi:hypothetical protein
VGAELGKIRKILKSRCSGSSSSNLIYRLREGNKEARPEKNGTVGNNALLSE